MSKNWFSEKLYSDFKQAFKSTKILFQGRTNFQDIVVFENNKFGRVLALDGVIQTTEADEFCYHEMITHVPLVAHGKAENILIIGGGDGGVLREALKHSIKRATMIELDEGVVRLCEEYMPTLSAGAFEDPRTDLRFMDGIKFVEESKEAFDVIIVDSTDPIGPGEVLFTDKFYKDCARRLTDRGILVTQSGVVWMQAEEAKATYKRLIKFFPDADLYVTQVPTYAAGLMALGWGCKDPGPKRTKKKIVRERISQLGLKTRYYNAEVHTSCFALPGYIKTLKD